MSNQEVHPGALMAQGRLHRIALASGANPSGPCETLFIVCALAFSGAVAVAAIIFCLTEYLGPLLGYISTLKLTELLPHMLVLLTAGLTVINAVYCSIALLCGGWLSLKIDRDASGTPRRLARLCTPYAGAMSSEVRRLEMMAVSDYNAAIGTNLALIWGPALAQAAGIFLITLTPIWTMELASLHLERLVMISLTGLGLSLLALLLVPRMRNHLLQSVSWTPKQSILGT